MNFIDIIAAIGLGYGAFVGFRNGVVREIAGLLGLVIGVWAGLRLGFIFASLLNEKLGIDGNFLPLLGFLVAFLIGIAAVYFVGRMTSTLINSVGIGLPNKLGGLIFGAAKWAFLLGTGLTLVANSGFITEEQRKGSLSYPFLHTFSVKTQDYTIGLVPAATNVLDDVGEYFIELDSTRRVKEGLPPLERPSKDSVATPDPS